MIDPYRLVFGLPDFAGSLAGTLRAGMRGECRAGMPGNPIEPHDPLGGDGPARRDGHGGVPGRSPTLRPLVARLLCPPRNPSLCARAVAVMFCATLPLSAQSLSGGFSGTDRSTACLGAADICQGQNQGRPLVVATIDWKVAVLAGEPLIDTHLAWRPQSLVGGTAYLAPPIYSTADPDLFFKPGDAVKQLRLYEAKARLSVQYGNAIYSIDTDLGVPAEAGPEQSYNVPASPDWSRLFRDRNGAFVPADLARQILRSDAMNGAKAALLSARLDTGRFETWWLDKNVGRYAAPLRAAIGGRLAALEVSFDLPTADLRAEIAGLGAGLTAGALVDRLESVLRKLAPDRLPAKFLGEGPERIARLHRYAQLVAETDGALREATEGLPPMPGSSRAYDTWYDQVAVRMNADAARLAHLQGLAQGGERAEAEPARQRQPYRIETDRPRREVLATLRPYRRPAASAGSRPGAEDHDASYPSAPDTSPGWGNTGWGDGGYRSSRLTALMNASAGPGSGTFYGDDLHGYMSVGDDCAARALHQIGDLHGEFDSAPAGPDTAPVRAGTGGMPRGDGDLLTGTNEAGHRDLGECNG